MIALTHEQLVILSHTINRAAQNRYCGGGKVMDELVDMGLMIYVGTPSWSPDPYYTITDAGRKAFNQPVIPTFKEQ